MIVCFSGKRRSGKDTAANVLIKKYGFNRISLADAVKQLSGVVFSEYKDYFFDDMLKDKEFISPVFFTKDKIINLSNAISNKYNQTLTVNDELCEKVCNIPLKSPRNILQVLGTDIVRNNVNPDVWLQIASRQILSSRDYVITDVRFKNEREFFKKMNSINCLIIRPELIDNTTHISENDLGDESEYDVVFMNDTKQGAFEEQIELWWYLRRKHG